MKRYSQFILSLCCGFVFFISSCNSKIEANSTTSNQIQNIQNSKNDCQKWQQIHESLSKDERNSFQKEGVYFISKEYLLSESLVKDCELRVKIGSFIWEGIMGKTSETDIEFAKQNSKDIIYVLQHIWESPNFSADGVHHEKYLLLLNDHGLKNEDIATFVGNLIKTKGLNSDGEEGEIFYLLFSDRFLPSLNQIISEDLTKSVRKEDIIGQFYALMILHRNTQETKYISKLKDISRNKNLSAKAKNILSKIVNILERGEKVDSEEVEKFRFAIFEQMPTSNEITDK